MERSQRTRGSVERDSRITRVDSLSDTYRKWCIFFDSRCSTERDCFFFSTFEREKWKNTGLGWFIGSEGDTFLMGNKIFVLMVLPKTLSYCIHWLHLTFTSSLSILMSHDASHTLPTNSTPVQTLITAVSPPSFTLGSFCRIIFLVGTFFTSKTLLIYDLSWWQSTTSFPVLKFWNRTKPKSQFQDFSISRPKKWTLIQQTIRISLEATCTHCPTSTMSCNALSSEFEWLSENRVKRWDGCDRRIESVLPGKRAEKWWVASKKRKAMSWFYNDLGSRGFVVVFSVLDGENMEWRRVEVAGGVLLVLLLQESSRGSSVRKRNLSVVSFFSD